MWTFSTPTERYFLRRGRGKAVVDEALGESFSGVLVSDFYAAYHHYDGPKQRCWAHLLRDIHDQRTLYPNDCATGQVGRRPSTGSMTGPKPSLIPRPSGGAPPNWPWERTAAGHRPALPGTTRRQPRASCAGASSATSRNSSSSWPNRTVPSDNNAAERSLRHLVISRKISGGTRSEQGTESKMTLASLFGTWRAQGLNPLAACRQLLVSPLLSRRKLQYIYPTESD